MTVRMHILPPAGRGRGERRPPSPAARPAALRSAGGAGGGARRAGSCRIGCAGCRRSRAAPPDLILLDFNLPKVNGLEAANHQARRWVAGAAGADAHHVRRPEEIRGVLRSRRQRLRH
ncbi:MAG: hypothetical protein R3F43_17200 [bacterium]